MNYLAVFIILLPAAAIISLFYATIVMSKISMLKKFDVEDCNQLRIELLKRRARRVNFAGAVAAVISSGLAEYGNYWSLKFVMIALAVFSAAAILLNQADKKLLGEALAEKKKRIAPEAENTPTATMTIVMQPSAPGKNIDLMEFAEDLRARYDKYQENEPQKMIGVPEEYKIDYEIKRRHEREKQEKDDNDDILDAGLIG